LKDKYIEIIIIGVAILFGWYRYDHQVKVDSNSKKDSTFLSGVNIVDGVNIYFWSYFKIVVCAIALLILLSLTLGRMLCQDC